MRARLLPNGHLLIPVRAESEGVIGDAAVEIGPDHPDYQRYLADLTRPGVDPEEYERAAEARLSELLESLPTGR